MIATDVTENYVIVQKRESLKLQKVPLHISRPYFPRGEKRESRSPSPERPTKKLKKNDEVTYDNDDRYSHINI